MPCLLIRDLNTRELISGGRHNRNNRNHRHDGRHGGRHDGGRHDGRHDGRRDGRRDGRHHHSGVDIRTILHHDRTNRLGSQGNSLRRRIHRSPCTRST